MDVSSVSIEEKKNQWSLLGRQGTATALVLLCLLLSHQRSLDPHFPALEAEPSSSMGSHRGRRSRNICNLILHAASLPTDVHPHGFLQPRLCWAGESLSSNCHIGTDPAPDAIIKLKFSSPLLLGLVFFFIALLWFCHTATSSALLAEGTRSGWSPQSWSRIFSLYCLCFSLSCRKDAAQTFLSH